MNSLTYKFVGALTFKKYSFTYRNWELNKEKSFDFFDNLGSSIHLELKGNQIIRVTPFLNLSKQNDWITDNMRFCLDVLNYQRLIFPLIKSFINLNKFFFFEISWSFVLFKFYFEKHYSFFLNKILNISFNSLTLVNSLIDNSSLIYLKNLTNTLGSNNIYNFNLPNINSNFMSDFSFGYLLNYNLQQNSNCFIFIGCNLRLESPLLWLKLKKQLKKKNTKFFFFGSNSFFTSNVFNLGNKINNFINFCEGRHLINSVISKLKNPVFFFGNQFNLKTNYLLKNLIMLNLKNIIKFNFQINWIHPFHININLLYFNYLPKKTLNLISLKTLSQFKNIFYFFFFFWY